MNRYQVRTDNGEIFTMTGTDPDHAARRVADLHGVTVVATRPDPAPYVGPVHPDQIIG
jgi:hypothetical protein